MVVLGSGSPDRSVLREVLRALQDLKHSKVVLDAEALRVLKDENMRALDPWILTPHPGELGGLIDSSAGEVEADRIRAVRWAQEKWGGQILLKGYQPGLITSDQEVWFLPFGDDRLGKAGSGDLLSGIIAGLWSQMEDGAQATALGVFIQADAARILTRNRARRSLLPSEIPPAIGRALHRLEMSRSI